MVGGLILNFSGQAGRKYPQWTLCCINGTRYPNDGTSAQTISTLPPSQRLSIGVSLHLRGGAV